MHSGTLWTESPLNKYRVVWNLGLHFLFVIEGVEFWLECLLGNSANTLSHLALLLKWGAVSLSFFISFRARPLMIWGGRRKYQTRIFFFLAEAFLNFFFPCEGLFKIFFSSARPFENYFFFGEASWNFLFPGGVFEIFFPYHTQSKKCLNFFSSRGNIFIFFSSRRPFKIFFSSARPLEIYFFPGRPLENFFFSRGGLWNFFSLSYPIKKVLEFFFLKGKYL